MKWLRAPSGPLLTAVLSVSILVMWVPARWSASVPEVALCLLAAFWCSGTVTLTPALVCLAAVPLLGLLQIMSGSTVYPFKTETELLWWISLTAAFFVATQIFTDHRQIPRFLNAMIAFASVLAVVSAAQLLTVDAKVFWLWDLPDRKGLLVPGPFSYHNQFAAFIELLFPAALYAALASSRHRIWYVLAAAAMYASVLVSASRGGFVFTTAELLLVPWLTWRRLQTSGRLILNSALLTAGIIAILVLAVNPEVLVQRLYLHDPYFGRREFLQSSLNMIRNRPLLGYGLGNWRAAYPLFATIDLGYFSDHAHNDWAQWTVEGGIPLLALMAAIAWRSVSSGFRSIWGLGPAVVFCHCLIDYPFYPLPLAGLMFSVVAATTAAPRGYLPGPQ